MPAGRLATLYAIVEARTEKYDRGLDKAAKRGAKFERQMGGVTKGVNGLNRGMAAAAKTAGTFAAGFVSFRLVQEAVDAASTAQETLSKFNVVFGDQADQIRERADRMAQELGRSRTKMRAMFSEAQDLFVPLGLAADEAAKMSERVAQLSIDLGSFNNKNPADVFNDLTSALTGSSETVKKYGVIVNEAAVKAELLANNINPKEATDAEKVMARLNIILAKTTAAQGDAARTADSYANRVKALSANWEIFLENAGQKIIPWAADVVGSFNDIVDAYNKLQALRAGEGGVPDTLEAIQTDIQKTVDELKTLEEEADRARGIRDLLDLLGGGSTVFRFGTQLEAENLEAEINRLQNHLDKLREAELNADSVVEDGLPQEEPKLTLAADAVNAAKNATTGWLRELGRIPDFLAPGLSKVMEIGNAIDDYTTRMNDLIAQRDAVLQSLKSPHQLYAEELNRLSALVEEGLLTIEQFEQAADKAAEGFGLDDKKDAPDVRLAGAITAGSADALSLAAKQQAAARGQAQVQKEQLAEQRNANALLEIIADNVEGLEPVALDVADV